MGLTVTPLPLHASMKVKYCKFGMVLAAAQPRQPTPALRRCARRTASVRRVRRLLAAATQSSDDGVQQVTWVARDGTELEVLQLRAPAGGAARRPPVVLLHGLFRAAWYWRDSLMPCLADAGHDCYALSLRGQGGSALRGSNTSADTQDSNSDESSGEELFPQGVPLAVNLMDIAAFIEDANFEVPPVLVGHSLGGMFVQEYLHTLHRQAKLQQQLGQLEQLGQGDKQQQQHRATQHQAPTPTLPTPGVEELTSQALVVPPLSGAVLLASACAGTVMSFGRFIADVGLREFLYQMYIVSTSAHLNDLATARYCWWGEDMPEAEAVEHLAKIRTASRKLPYVTKEVAAWRPLPPPPDERAALLPPVLSLGGGADRIIRPYQVAAASSYWGADVIVLPGVTHDVLLGPQAAGVAQHVLSWLQGLANKSAAVGPPPQPWPAAGPADEPTCTGSSSGDGGNTAAAAAAQAAAAAAAADVTGMPQLGGL